MASLSVLQPASGPLRVFDVDLWPKCLETSGLRVQLYSCFIDFFRSSVLLCDHFLCILLKSFLLLIFSATTVSMPKGGIKCFLPYHVTL